MKKYVFILMAIMLLAVIFFDQASCAYCDMLKNNVLSNSDVQKQLNENYVVLFVDINENPKFADKYRVCLRRYKWKYFL